MKKGRLICLLLTICMLMTTLGGCDLLDTLKNMISPKENPGYSTVVPVYTDDKQLEIMAYWSPPITEQQYQWMKDCGMTAVIVDRKYDAYTGVNSRRILQMCEELGLDVYFVLDKFYGAEQLKPYESFVQYSSFAGFYIDEPYTKSHLDNVADQARGIYEMSPNLRHILNITCEVVLASDDLLWAYPSKEALDAAIANGDFFTTYEDYTNYAMDVVLKPNSNVMLTATNYPMVDYRTETLRETWLNTLGKCQTISSAAGSTMLQFVQSAGHKNGNNEFFLRQPTEADVRWLRYTTLAYGGEGFMDFVYTSLSDGGEVREGCYGPIYWTDVNDYNTYYRTDVWYSIQKVNKELNSFDHVLLSFDWQGVLCHNVKNDPSVKPVFDNAVGKLSEHKRLEKIKSTGDLLIGCFKDENDYDGFLVVNFTETVNNSRVRNEVSITFDYATKALVYINGQEKLVTLKNHTFTHTMLPGEGFFIIPIA